MTDDLMLRIADEAARWFELTGIAAIVAGALFAIARAALVTAGLRRAGEGAGHSETVSAFRKTLGRSILVGLELLVAADIIRTVAIEPTMQSVLVLAVIVAIRTFLSISLGVEIDGRWPWQRVPET